MIMVSHKERPMNRTLYTVLIAALLAAAPTRAQQQQEQPQQDPPAPPPAEPAPSEPEPEPEPPALPGLDELLGTGGRGGNATDPSQTELQRRLSGQELNDAFKEAVQLMGQAATRLKTSDDPDRAGLGTQRVQEDAVRKLDQLIAQIEQNARQRSRSQRSRSDQQDQQNQQQQQRQRTQRQESRTGENNSEMEPPARRDGPLRPELDAARASWGALPARVRDMLLQGSSDRFSSMYEKMTEEYYRRLAEERRQR